MLLWFGFDPKQLVLVKSLPNHEGNPIAHVNACMQARNTQPIY